MQSFPQASASAQQGSPGEASSEGGRFAVRRPPPSEPALASRPRKAQPLPANGAASTAAAPRRGGRGAQFVEAIRAAAQSQVPPPVPTRARPDRGPRADRGAPRQVTTVRLGPESLVGPTGSNRFVRTRPTALMLAPPHGTLPATEPLSSGGHVVRTDRDSPESPPSLLPPGGLGAGATEDRFGAAGLALDEPMHLDDETPAVVDAHTAEGVEAFAPEQPAPDARSPVHAAAQVAEVVAEAAQAAAVAVEATAAALADALPAEAAPAAAAGLPFTPAVAESLADAAPVAATAAAAVAIQTAEAAVTAQLMGPDTAAAVTPAIISTEPGVAVTAVGEICAQAVNPVEHATVQSPLPPAEELQMELEQAEGAPAEEQAAEEAAEVAAEEAAEGAAEEAAEGAAEPDAHARLQGSRREEGAAVHAAAAQAPPGVGGAEVSLQQRAELALNANKGVPSSSSYHWVKTTVQTTLNLLNPWLPAAAGKQSAPSGAASSGAPPAAASVTFEPTPPAASPETAAPAADGGIPEAANAASEPASEAAEGGRDVDGSGAVSPAATTEDQAGMDAADAVPGDTRQCTRECTPAYDEPAEPGAEAAAEVAPDEGAGASGEGAEPAASDAGADADAGVAVGLVGVGVALADRGGSAAEAAEPCGAPDAAGASGGDARACAAAEDSEMAGAQTPQGGGGLPVLHRTGCRTAHRRVWWAGSFVQGISWLFGGLLGKRSRNVRHGAHFCRTAMRGHGVRRLLRGAPCVGPLGWRCGGVRAPTRLLHRHGAFCSSALRHGRRDP